MCVGSFNMGPFSLRFISHNSAFLLLIGGNCRSDGDSVSRYSGRGEQRASSSTSPPSGPSYSPFRLWQRFFARYHQQFRRNDADAAAAQTCALFFHGGDGGYVFDSSVAQKKGLPSLARLEARSQRVSREMDIEGESRSTEGEAGWFQPHLLVTM